MNTCEVLYPSPLGRVAPSAERVAPGGVSLAVHRTRVLATPFALVSGANSRREQVFEFAASAPRALPSAARPATLP